MNTCLPPILEKHEQKTVRQSKQDRDGFTVVKYEADVSHEIHIQCMSKQGSTTYLCRQTPSSAPQPRCAPSSAVGPCTECKDPGGGAVAATQTARPRGSHTAGCWSAGDCERRWTRTGREKKGVGSVWPSQDEGVGADRW